MLQGRALVALKGWMDMPAPATGGFANSFQKSSGILRSLTLHAIVNQISLRLARI